MMILNPGGNVNVHTHTCYCDGKDTPEEMVKAAIELGFCALGFSGHEYSVNDADFCMRRESAEVYRKEVLALRDKYRGKLDIYLGIERDYFGKADGYPYDYVIGSLHYVEKNGILLSVDNTAEIMEQGVADLFGGDYRAYVERYFEILADVAERTGADIVGHFDLVTKFNEGNRYFDEDSVWYKRAALKALAKIAKSRPIFEINTGAMARGYRSRPYPPPYIISEIERLGCPMIVTSDCHDKEKLDFAFTDVLKGLQG